jgi:nitrous oxidase accessory protein
VRGFSILDFGLWISGVWKAATLVWLALAVGVGAQTLQSRIDRAAVGATVMVPAGTHEGPVVISKALTLRGEPGAAIRGNGKTHVVHVAAEGVTLEGLAISGSGLDLGKDHAGVFIEANRAAVRGCTITDSLHGIYVKKANDCALTDNRIAGKAEIIVPLAQAQGLEPLRARPGAGENCEIALDQNRRGNGIHLWNSERATIAGNEIRDARDGIYFSFANHCTIRGNRITRVRFALHYMYSDGNVFEGNRFTDSASGSTLMFSRNMVIRGNTFAANTGHRAYGMVFTQCDTTRVEGNVFTGNSISLCVEYSNMNTFVGNRFERSYIGARLTGGSDGNRFARNVFAGNLHPVELDGDFSNNQWSDGRRGNRWGNSTEIDFDGDGIGDLPHREADLLGPLRRPFPLAALLSGSPALDAVRFAQQHAKIPGVHAIHDPRPLTAAHGAGKAAHTASRPFLAELFARIVSR